MDTETAVHEAAHAVAALVQGLPVVHVAVGKQYMKGAAGYCLSREVPGYEHQRIVFKLAGQAAEEILLKHYEPCTYVGDQREARRLLKRIGGPDDLKPYHAVARALVRKHARTIIDVAALLLACGKVDGVTVAQMVYPHVPQRIAKRSKLTVAERLNAATANPIRKRAARAPWLTVVCDLWA